MKKSPLTEEEIKEVELFNSLPYDELIEYIKNKPILESKENVIKNLDMTCEEFVSAYDAVDLSHYLNSAGINLDNI